MRSNVDIVGRYDPGDEKNWVILHYTYDDEKIKDGFGCGNLVCSRNYADKLYANKDNLAVGYDKERHHKFLYVKKG